MTFILTLLIHYDIYTTLIICLSCRSRMVWQLQKAQVYLLWVYPTRQCMLVVKHRCKKRHISQMINMQNHTSCLSNCLVMLPYNTSSKWYFIFNCYVKNLTGDISWIIERYAGKLLQLHNLSPLIRPQFVFAYACPCRKTWRLDQLPGQTGWFRLPSHFCH